MEVEERIKGPVIRDKAFDKRLALAAPSPVQHRNSIPPQELPGLIVRLRGIGSVTALAAVFTIQTMDRTAETRFVTWDEITSDGIFKTPGRISWKGMICCEKEAPPKRGQLTGGAVVLGRTD
jgi:hypothetical protein